MKLEKSFPPGDHCPTHDSTHDSPSVKKQDITNSIHVPCDHMAFVCIISSVLCGLIYNLPVGAFNHSMNEISDRFMNQDHLSQQPVFYLKTCLHQIIFLKAALSSFTYRL